MKQFTITEADSGQRLDKFLGKYLNKAPKSFLYKMLRKKNITLNGKKATGSEMIAPGDEIRLFFSDETVEKFSEVSVPVAVNNSNIDVLYEDEHILLLNKPLNMLSQKARPEDVSMVEHLISYLYAKGDITDESLRTFHPSVVNRLDRNTSGILAAGKDLKGAQFLSGLFKDRSVHKYYYCLVKGIIQEEAHIEGWLLKDEKTNKVTVSKTQRTKEDLPIETQYIPIDHTEELTLLKVLLITGRSHQIRAHLASIGHPIIGDFKYGHQKLNEAYEKEFHLTHQLLHAGILEMPVLNGEFAYLSKKVFHAPLPKKFARIMEKKGLSLCPHGIHEA